MKWNRRTAKSDKDGAARVAEYWRQRQRKQEADMEPKKSASGPSPPPEPTAVQNCIQLKLSPLSTLRPWWWERYVRQGGRVKPPKKPLPITRNSSQPLHR
jgi:hypothetical protein